MLEYASPQDVGDSIQNIAEQVYAEPKQRTQLVAELLDTEAVVTSENRYRRKDGAIWHGNLILSVVKDEDGHPKCLEGFVEDITQRRQTEDNRR